MTDEALPLPKIPPSAYLASFINELVTFDGPSAVAKIKMHQAARIIATFCSPAGNYGRPPSASEAGVTDEDADFLHSIVNRFPPAGDGTQRREIVLDENDGQAIWEIARRLRRLSTGRQDGSNG